LVRLNALKKRQQKEIGRFVEKEKVRGEIQEKVRKREMRWLLKNKMVDLLLDSWRGVRERSWKDEENMRRKFKSKDL